MKILLFVLFLLVGCQQEAKRSGKRTVNLEQQAQMVTGKQVARQVSNRFAGKIEKTMNASKYTYILLNNGKEKIWLAGPMTSVSVGDSIAAEKGMLLEGFKSKTLNKTFDKIYFVSKWITKKDSPNAQNDHTKIKKKIFVKKIKLTNGEISITSLYQDKKKYNNKKIRVRGTVVKFLEQIMGKNWIHIEDGSSTDKDDLTITTTESVKVGDIVSFEGVIRYSKDFGYGYFYPVIMEQGKLVK